MPTDFLKAPDRTHTHSLKWTQYPDGVLPVWVADMDFQAPEPILEALRAKLEHGVLGYEFPQKALCETVAARMDALYGWSVDPQAIVATPRSTRPPGLSASPAKGSSPSPPPTRPSWASPKMPVW